MAFIELSAAPSKMSAPSKFRPGGFHFGEFVDRPVDTRPSTSSSFLKGQTPWSSAISAAAAIQKPYDYSESETSSDDDQSMNVFFGRRTKPHMDSIETAGQQRGNLLNASCFLRLLS